MHYHNKKSKKIVLIITSISLIFTMILILLVYKLLFNKQNNDAEWTLIQLDASELNNLQSSVDNGHTPGMLDPEEVALTLLNQMNIDKIYSVETIEKNKDLCLVEITLQNGIKVKMKLIQPVIKGKTGIWAVKAYSISTN